MSPCALRHRPLAALVLAEKRAVAIAYLQARNLYVLDRGSKRPDWGIPSKVA